MTGLAVAGTMVILASAIAIVAMGIVAGVRVLRRGPAPGDLAPTPALRDIALALILGVGGVVAGSILTVAAWVAEREAHALEPHRTAVHLGAMEEALGGQPGHRPPQPGEVDELGA